jgi:Ca2+-binding RTX toxin-like protein
LRGLRKRFRAGGRSFRDRGRAFALAVAVLLAIALAGGAVVIAETIDGQPGYEVITGTPEDDVIHARDGGPDTIDCGAGDDTVYVDRSEDGVFDCETVIAP